MVALPKGFEPFLAVPKTDVLIRYTKGACLTTERVYIIWRVKSRTIKGDF